MIQKEQDGFSSVSHQKAVEGRPINVVRTKSLLKNIELEYLYQAFWQLEKYHKFYDPKNMMKEWKIAEPMKVDDNGVLTGEVYSVCTFGPMCSNRFLQWRFEVTRTPERITMLMYTV